jgi:transposase
LDTPSRAYKTSKSTTSESLEEENKRLRKELANIKKEREILKKAAAYFAKETL